jgi:hypothetical protein
MESSNRKVTISSSRKSFSAGHKVRVPCTSGETSLGEKGLGLFLPIESKRSTIHLNGSTTEVPLTDRRSGNHSIPTKEEDREPSLPKVRWVQAGDPLVTVDCCFGDVTPIRDTFIERIRCSRAHDSVDKIYIYEQTEFVSECGT